MGKWVSRDEFDGLTTLFSILTRRVFDLESRESISTPDTEEEDSICRSAVDDTLNKLMDSFASHRRVSLLTKRVMELERKEGIRCTDGPVEEPEIFFKDFTRKDEVVIEFLKLLDEEMFRAVDWEEYRDAKEKALIKFEKEGK